ncbi:ABC transporter substrate-binding protein [Desertimonas flava]|jgi:ABC-type branched-subunit amino acid transport system substrate-binding protein|uniref:ABC transporter substrate-binding protein n=1 Tax=Desertimonas flava TaxID=2064846 RepID=UPI000E34B385|nr:ABC transporter substrate-binding protein [Desertimonas flava]
MSVSKKAVARLRRRSVVAVAAVAVLTAAAGGTTAATSGGEDTAAGSAAAPSGDPIKIMVSAPVDTQLPPYPNIPGAAEVYEQWVNANGGVAGRPLEVITCDNKGDPNEGANCARQAVEESVVAVVGSFTFDASRIIPVLEEANIAWFGACCPLVAQEFSSPISFVLGSLLPGMGAGLGWKMAQDGCENPVNLVIDIPAGDVAFPAVQAAYAVGGGDPEAIRMVKIPAIPQDYSAQVAEATEGSDCIAGGISDSNWAAWLPAMAAAGANQRLYGLQGNLNSKIVEQFPELTEGAVVSGSYPNIAGPMWDDYRAALEEYDAPDLDWNSLAGLGTWAALTAFKIIVEGIDGDIDNNTFIDAANATTELDTGGMIGVLDLTQPYTGFGGAFPRVFNRTVFFDVASGGELTALDDQAYDMTGPIDGEPIG